MTYKKTSKPSKRRSNGNGLKISLPLSFKAGNTTFSINITTKIPLNKEKPQ